MAQQATLDTVSESITDLATSISDLTSMMAAEFTTVRQEIADVRQEVADVRQEARDSEDRLSGRMTGLERRIDTGFAEVYTYQRETNERLARLEGDAQAHEVDIKELYEMIASLQADVKSLTKEESRRLADLEAFAMQVAEKTGVPFKRRGSRQGSSSDGRLGGGTKSKLRS